MDKRAEIISMVERRRHWPTEEKLRIMEAALAPGAVIAAVADRNGVCRSLLYTWLRQARAGQLSGISLTAPLASPFVPIRIEEPAPPKPASPSAVPALPSSSRRRTSIVEIVLGNGRVVKVEDSIDPVALARLIAALDGGAA
jgi:transposase